MVLASPPMFTGLFCFHLVAEQWCGSVFTYEDKDLDIPLLDFITELVLFNWKNLLVHVVGLRQVQLLLMVHGAS